MSAVMATVAERQGESTRIWSRTFIIIFVANMAMNLGQMMSNSLLSVYAKSLGASASAIGVLMSTFAITALLFKIVAGPAMDTYNRKYLVIGAMLLLATAFLGFSMASSVRTLMAFRLVQGAGQAFGNVCFLAMVAAVLPKERYGAGMGYYSLAQVVSQAIGPTVGLWLSGLFGFSATFLINTGVMLLAVLFALQIKLPFKRTKQFRINLHNIVAKEALLPALLMFCLMTAFFVVNAFLIVYAAEQGVTAGIGLFFTVSAVTMVFSRPYVGRLTDRYGLVKVLIPALLSDVVAFFIISGAHTLWMFLVAALISAFGFGACQPALQTLAMKSVPNERRGAASSTNFIGVDLGTLTGPVVAGVIAQSFGYAVMWRVMVIPMLVAMLLVYLFRARIATIEHSFSTRVEATH